MVIHPEHYAGIALAAGAGGLELGLSLALPQYRTVCWVERDAYAAAALVARMADKSLDTAPVWSDLVTFDGRPWRGKVDILSAGYPCQPFSQSGKRLGEKDPRHLWPHVRRILAETGAPVLFAENVPGHVTLGLETVRRDLLKMGYALEAGIFSAAEVGASHIRKRLFLLAYADGEGIRHMAARVFAGWAAGNGAHGAPGGHTPGGENVDAAVPHGHGAGARLFPPDAGSFDAWDRWLAARPGLQPAISRGPDGLASRLDRSRLAGNGVVPLAAGYAFGTLAAAAAKNAGTAGFRSGTL